MLKQIKNFFSFVRLQKEISHLNICMTMLSSDYTRLLRDMISIQLVYSDIAKDLETMLRLYTDFKRKWKEGTLTDKDIEYHDIVIESLNVRQKFRNGGTDENTKRNRRK